MYIYIHIYVYINEYLYIYIEYIEFYYRIYYLKFHNI